VTVHRAS